MVGAFIVGIGSEMATVYGGSSSRVLIFGLALSSSCCSSRTACCRRSEAAWRKRRPVDTEYTDQAGALGAGTLQVRRPASSRGRSSPQVEQAAKAGAGAPLLEVKGADKAFGGLVAVDGADLTVRQGSDHCADRSERLRQDDAVQPRHRRDDRPTAGEVWLDGTRIDRLHPWERGHLGLPALSRPRGCSSR